MTRDSKRLRAGFTITEMLAVMAILALAGTIAVTGIPAAQRAYVAAVDASNAQVMLSTAGTQLRDELSVADPSTSSVQVSNSVTDGDMLFVTFRSLETGYETQVRCRDSQGIYVLQQTDDGATSVETPLVPEKATAGASQNLRVKASSIDYADGVFTVRDLRVENSQGEEVADAAVPELAVRAIAAPTT